MLFNTFQYWLFFLIVFVGFYSIPYKQGKVLLLLASIYFYMSWNPYFIILLASIIIIDYYAGILIDAAEGPNRKLWLLISLVANLGILGFFKYYNFFSTLVAQALGRPEDSFLLNIILPLGISFHTFQSMSYTIDVYRKLLKPERSFLDFSLFVLFFPQLVAGPIVRAQTFFPELRNWIPPSNAFIARGVMLILVGLIKKCVFADNLAILSDGYFSNVYENPGLLAAWSGTFAFAMQIFFDFSGYTDIARGCAYILGFEFPLNFARPYLSRSITEFWRRWHISLSSWLRDYLYIPLGGNRFGTLKTYRNLMITMVLGGFWHGASWNFMIWGAFHGALLSIHRIISNFWSPSPQLFMPLRVLYGLASALVTFICVLISWVFFRAKDLTDSTFVIRNLFSSVPSEKIFMSTGLGLSLFLALLIALLEEKWGIFERLAQSRFWVRVGACVIALFILQIFSFSERNIPFVYFQF